MSLVPQEAIKKKPTVTTQHMATGHEERSRCNDSAVAQQLTAAKAKKARMPKIFKNLLSFIIITIFPRFPSEELKRLIIRTNKKKRGNCLSSVPPSEAFALPDTVEQTTLESTLI